jgi:hypothetical protein
VIGIQIQVKIASISASHADRHSNLQTMSFRAHFGKKMSFRERSSGSSNPQSPPIRRKRNVNGLLAIANVGTTPQKQPTAKAAKAASGLDAKALKCMYSRFSFSVAILISLFLFLSGWRTR